ncbi:MAG: hypothetical protein KJ558_01205 [Gammaproteobacteria bacterium]|nr:hypothetical protein [Gammaproteobacteria bacterium]MBU1653453.1 hypothetical protein [Gammaproteobacteria bacterium]MBU1961921.1 hypothetical protein [Gammaproteobacteria bacterium]
MYRLTEGHFIYPTPGGAYYATLSPRAEPARMILQRMLGETETPLLSQDLLQSWSGLEAEEALALVHRMQARGFVQGLDQPLKAPTGKMEELLSAFLKELSDDGKVVLAESQGFYVGSSGYPHETAVELSALSSELVDLQERHAGLVDSNLGLAGGAWALVNAAGNSEIGFWPLFYGGERFTLIAGGMPQFNCNAFISLVWVLGQRYGQSND